MTHTPRAQPYTGGFKGPRAMGLSHRHEPQTQHKPTAAPSSCLWPSSSTPQSERCSKAPSWQSLSQGPCACSLLSTGHRTESLSLGASPWPHTCILAGPPTGSAWPSLRGRLVLPYCWHVTFPWGSLPCLSPRVPHSAFGWCHPYTPSSKFPPNQCHPPLCALPTQMGLYLSRAQGPGEQRLPSVAPEPRVHHCASGREPTDMSEADTPTALVKFPF